MMSFIRGLGTGAIGGAIGAVAVLSFFVVSWAGSQGVDAGAWLNFAAVFFGVAATMIGTLAIDGLKRREEERRALQATLSALSVMKTTIEQLPAVPMNSHIADLRQQHAYIGSLASSVRPHTVAKYALHYFDFHVPQIIRVLARPDEFIGPQYAAAALEHSKREIMIQVTTCEIGVREGAWTTPIIPAPGAVTAPTP